uniref:RING-type domain-containing protein n=1 Tax=Acanthochromis polyacanthus TaxID=80966 RepID=A0A3Q1GM60_9TELE
APAACPSHMDQNKLSCSICLDLLKDPVTIPCGHIYCLDCIKNCWDRPHLEQVYSCPQCRHTFRLRPDLKKNTVLADLIEELMKTRLQSAAADLCHAGPGDVSWDFCTGRKLKAVKSCLQCLVSYCEQLVDLFKKLQENICSGHNEVMKIFCHNTVSAPAERNDKQRVVGLNQVQIHQRIQDREKDVRMLQQQVKAINQSADKAVANSEEIQGLIRRIEKRNSDVKQQIRSKQTDEVRKVRELQEKLKQELVELKMRVTRQIQVYGHHPDRFMEKQQVLSKESLTGRCYWEVEQRPAIVSVAVTYKGISRTGPESAFAYNKKSWALENSNIFVHNRILTLIRGSPSSRIGVYLDHSAGILSFYRVSDTMTLLHRVQTAFAQPLYAGLGINGVGSGKLCQLIYTDVIKEAKSENLFV